MFEKLRQKIFGASSRERGEAALFLAAERLDVEEVQRLLDGGADANARDAFEYTPLMRVVSGTSRPCERQATLALLLAAGADVDAIEQAGQTALIHAAHHDALGSVELLLRSGANPRVRASSGCDALQIAFEHANAALAGVLAAAELSDPTTPRPLVCAAFMGDVDRLRHELERGGPPRASEAELTALHAAVCAGHVEIVRLLLNAGAEVDAGELEGVTPLIQAARMGHADIAKALVERGADLSRRTQAAHGDDALAAAARHGHREVVVALLDAGAPPNASGNNGSVLAVAASAGHEDIVALVLERGARVDGPGPLCAAASSRNVAIVERLLAAGADPNARIEMPQHMIAIAPLTNAIATTSPEIAARLVAAGADVNTRDPSGETFLILLAEMTPEGDEQVAMATTLIRAGADVNARAEHGRTALALAEQRGHERLVSLLRDAGARADR